MAWFINHYHCGDCGADWDDEWSCCCDDECPECGSSDWSPVSSDDLSEIIGVRDGIYVVMQSPDTADHKPRYREVAQFSSKFAASRFVNEGELVDLPLLDA